VQATVPEELRTKTLRDIPENTTGYTVPWAMVEDDNGLLWLNETFEYFDHMSNSNVLKVTRRDNGWKVDIRIWTNHNTCYYYTKVIDRNIHSPVTKLITKCK